MGQNIFDFFFASAASGIVTDDPYSPAFEDPTDGYRRMYMDNVLVITDLEAGSPMWDEVLNGVYVGLSNFWTGSTAESTGTLDGSNSAAFIIIQGKFNNKDFFRNNERRFGVMFEGMTPFKNTTGSTLCQSSFTQEISCKSWKNAVFNDFTYVDFNMTAIVAREEIYTDFEIVIPVATQVVHGKQQLNFYLTAGKDIIHKYVDGNDLNQTMILDIPTITMIRKVSSQVVEGSRVLPKADFSGNFLIDGAVYRVGEPTSSVRISHGYKEKVSEGDITYSNKPGSAGASVVFATGWDIFGSETADPPRVLSGFGAYGAAHQACKAFRVMSDPFEEEVVSVVYCPKWL